MISVNTALTVAAMQYATVHPCDTDSRDKLADLINGRSHDDLKRLALDAMWELGTKLHRYAPDDIARMATLSNPEIIEVEGD